MIWFLAGFLCGIFLMWYIGYKMAEGKDCGEDE